jgi:dUTP pyrophosphatase
MATLLVKLLHPFAQIPTVATPGEDLGFDLYTSQDTFIEPNLPTKVKTGVALVYKSRLPWRKYGLILKERSGLASKGLKLGGGVVDAGYRGEVLVIVSDPCHDFPLGYTIPAGTKICQAVPARVRTSKVKHVDELPEGKRGDRGFGSSGR